MLNVEINALDVDYSPDSPEWHRMVSRWGSQFQPGNNVSVDQMLNCLIYRIEELEKREEVYLPFIEAFQAREEAREQLLIEHPELLPAKEQYDLLVMIATGKHPPT